jgi:hypothetical protein
MRKTKWVLGLAAVISLTTNARSAIFQPDLLEITQTNVSRWNVDTPGTSYLRSTGTSGFGDMTRMKDGRIVAYRTDTASLTPALFEIDPVTGTSALLVQSTAAPLRVVALAPMANGNLLGCDNTLGFVSINPATLSYTPVAMTTTNPLRTFGSGGMAASPGGQIYAWCSGITASSSIYSKLFKLDPLAGTATEIGGFDGLSTSGSLNAMSFTPDGRLFGFTDVNGGSNGAPFQPNSIYELNLQTGIPTLVASRTELINVRGVVFLPEPGAALLITITIAPLLSRHARKRLSSEA